MMLHIVRHARTNENNQKVLQEHFDSVLDETGKLQATYLATRFRNIPVSHIYTSDLQRAHATALSIHAEHPQAQLHVTDILREKSFGKYNGMLKADIAKDIGIDDPKQIYDIITNLPGAENAAMADERAATYLETLVQTHAHTDDSVVLLTHAGFKHHLIKYLYQKTSKEVTTFLKFKNTAISTYSITTEAIEEISLNDYSHLPAELCD